MNDDLLRIICKSKDPRLADSKALLQRIENRDLYKICGEAIIDKDMR